MEPSARGEAKERAAVSTTAPTFVPHCTKYIMSQEDRCSKPNLPRSLALATAAAAGVTTTFGGPGIPGAPYDNDESTAVGLGLASTKKQTEPSTRQPGTNQWKRVFTVEGPF